MASHFLGESLDLATAPRSTAPNRPRRLVALLTTSLLAVAMAAPFIAAPASAAPHRDASGRADMVLPAAARPVYMGQPQLNGDPTVGGILKAELGGYAPFVIPEGGTPSFTYRWTRDGQAIAGATGSTYRATAADLGRVIAVFVTVSYDAESRLTLQADYPLRIAAKPRARGFNGDDTLDIFARDAAGRLLLYPTDGRGNWRAAQVLGTGWNVFNLLFSPGDFDGDGTVDVIGRDAQGRLFLYQGNGTGGWKKAFQIGQGWQGFKTISAAGDFNGDGSNDLIVVDQWHQAILYPGNGRGGFLQAYGVDTYWINQDPVFAMGHFGGRSNLGVVSRDIHGELWLHESSRNGWFAGTEHIGTGFNGLTSVGSAGDFNGDNKIDAYSIDASGRLTMYYGKGSDYLNSGRPDIRWYGQSVVGWGWGGFTAVF
ncbi:VCBS repeat-containing protein [Paenarthrobacter aurescens]|uniref:VCBS repeat-containing protein n=1 Tax=Paenarthrobacter aurescens TaxID=43663 RepID=UPI0021C17A0B|nr:VCBS repeat-containing protein [Paenarthrobacter aurescens]MCT9869957.1 VCBS repeat-containing protein [Paenarthrobacter aurescens]